MPDEQRQQSDDDRRGRQRARRNTRGGHRRLLLEYGYERTTEAVAEAFVAQIDEAADTQFDFKSDLQERLAQRGRLVSYSVVSEEGPPHSKLFESVAEVEGEVIGRGSGRQQEGLRATGRQRRTRVARREEGG